MERGILTNGWRDGAGQETKAIETIDDSKPTSLDCLGMSGINCCNMVIYIQVILVMVMSMVIEARYWSAEEQSNQKQQNT